MSHDAVDSATPTPRRGFIGRLAAGAVAVAVTGGSARSADAATIVDDPSPVAADAWLAGIKGKHRQFFDAVSVNDGWPLAFAMTFLNTTEATYKLSDREVTAVVGLRHMAIPLAFDDATWAKYKLGEFLKVNDPSTSAPAVRNRYINPHEGELFAPGMAVEKLLARGAIITVCNVALTVLSGMAAKAAGLPPEAAKAEWTAGLIKGAYVVPSGVLAVNRAQESRCTYCYAG